MVAGSAQGSEAGPGMGGLFRGSKTVLSLSRLSVIFGSFVCRCLLYLNITSFHYNRAANESLMRLEDVWCFVVLV